MRCGAFAAVLLLQPLVYSQSDDKAIKDKQAEVMAFLKTAKMEREFRAATSDLSNLAEQAFSINKYELAAKLYADAEKIARTSLKDAALGQQYQDCAKKAVDVGKEYAKASKAMSRILSNEATPEDYMTSGKFLCFVKGDWELGLNDLSKGKDEVLKKLAEDDLAAANPSAVGDAWFGMIKKEPPAKERTLHWYKKAWPDLKGIAKEKLRTRVADMQGLPGAKDWTPINRIAGWTFAGDSGLGLRYAVSGKTSARIAKAKEKPSYVMMDRLSATPGKEFTLTVYLLSDQTEGSGGHAAIYWYDKDKKICASKDVPIQNDFPFWQKGEIKGVIPQEAVTTAFDVVIESPKGAIWIDDVSVKVEGVEIIKNGSFEDK